MSTRAAATATATATRRAARTTNTNTRPAATKPKPRLEPDAIYTPAELRAVVTIGRDKLFRLLRTGEIACKQDGRTYLVKGAAFLAWMAAA